MRRRHNRWRYPLAAALAALLASSCSDGTGPSNPLRITTSALPLAVVGQPYAEGVNAEGGDQEYEWEIVEGRLPRGLVLTVEGLTDDDVLIQGTPERQDSASFSLQVRSGDGQVRMEQFTIEVIPNPIETVALPPALVGMPYDVPLREAPGFTGGTWAIVEGQLPPGLEFTNASITGTPTATDTVQLTVRLTGPEVTIEETFELRVVRNQPDDYQITPFEVTEISPAIRAHLDAAILEWEQALTGDLGAGTISAGQFGSNVCSGYGEDLNGTSIDDLLLLVNIESIDGAGRVLGQAGPCLIRDVEGGDLPAAGILTLDLDDLEPLIGTETLTFIISHEIGHVLGYGTLWEGLLSGEDTDDPRFTGERAVAEWQALGGTGLVPVEADGGEGTELSHWDEVVFNRERMTGFTEEVGVDQPLSRVSIASLADIGYAVDLSAADPFLLPMALRAEGDTRSSAYSGTLGFDLLYDGPVGVIETVEPGRSRQTTLLPQR